MDSSTREYLCIDAFCGAGGLSLGLKSSGLTPVYSFDNNDRAVCTYRLNLKSRCDVVDARDLPNKNILDSISDREISLLAGGPPCQGFSNQNKTARPRDKRNGLVLEFARLVRIIKPLFFLLENVAQLGKKRGKNVLDSVYKELSDYEMYPHSYNSADYGMAQTRTRFIVVGQLRSPDSGHRFKIPTPEVGKRKTVEEVLYGLPEPPQDHSNHPSIPNHYRTRVSRKNIERFSFVPQGGGWKDIPYDLRLPCHQRLDQSTGTGGWRDVYGRLSADGQAPTITAGFSTFTKGRYGHPFEDRPITPREAARLQGFPDDFVFVGNNGDVCSQIGNAVPPPLACRIGESIIASLKSEEEGK